MDPYSEQGRISPITLTSPGGSGHTSATVGRHRREERAYDRYGSLNTRHSQEHKARDKFGSLDRSAAMTRYGYRDARDRSMDRGGGSAVEYTSRSSSLQRNRSVERDYPLVSLSMRSLADNPDMVPTAVDFESDFR